MARLTVKDVPDKLHRRLKDRARANRRSLNSEIIVCLEATVGSQELDTETLLARAALLRNRVGGHLTDSDLEGLR